MAKKPGELDTSILRAAANPKMRVLNEPMRDESRRGSASTPAPSPVSHASPRNEALRKGTRRDGFEPPLLGMYSPQAGAPLGYEGTRSWQAEQSASDQRQGSIRDQVGDIVEAGYRGLKPYKAG
jgi:hypothetical protein